MFYYYKYYVDIIVKLLQETLLILIDDHYMHYLINTMISIFSFCPLYLRPLSTLISCLLYPHFSQLK